MPTNPFEPPKEESDADPATVSPAMEWLGIGVSALWMMMVIAYLLWVVMNPQLIK